MNTNTDIVQRPSGWKRALILGALGRYTFSNDKEPDPLEFYGGAIAELLDCIGSIEVLIAFLSISVAVGFVCAEIAMSLDPSRSWITLIWVLAILLWPLPGFLLFLLVVLPFRWLRIWARRGLCFLLARLTCPTELKYYRMRNQARLDERLKMRSSQYRDCQYGAEQELSREKSAPPHLESPDHESDVLKSAIRRGCVESGKTVVPAAAMLLTATAIIHIGHRLMSGNIKK